MDMPNVKKNEIKQENTELEKALTNHKFEEITQKEIKPLKKKNKKIFSINNKILRPFKFSGAKPS